MVAICGWIMPAPFAMPRTVTCFDAVLNRADAIFGRVSVVIMAWAKVSALCSCDDRAAISSGNFAQSFSAGNRTPMMPVEDGKISEASTLSRFPASRQTFSQARMPSRPVAQLALPEFTTTARIRPPVERNAARPTSMGAATTRFVVNSAAAAAPSATSTSARSGRPLTLIPAVTAENENPLGKRIFSGDRLSDVMPESSTSFSVEARLQMQADCHESLRLHRSDRAADTDNNLCGSCREDPDG